MANRVTWTSPHGNTIDLTDEGAGFLVEPAGTRGLRSVRYSMSTDQYAGVDGAVVRGIKAEPGELSLRLKIGADGERELHERIRYLAHEMLPQAGPGTLTVETPWGDRRSINCYYVDGLEGDEDLSVMQPGRWYKTVIKLYAPDGWWYGPEKQINVGLGELPEFFPIFPVTLASSTVQGEFEVDLTQTDAKAFPRWTIRGPGSNLVLANETTGKRIELESTLAVGDRLVINTKPGEQSVRLFTPDLDPAVDRGINQFRYLKSHPALWELAVTKNRITAALTGATEESRITGVYTPRYAGI